MKRELIVTKDGSHTFYLPDLEERYHSIHGAIAEGQHVFIEKGLKYQLQNGYQKLAILEVGFGTGLNCLLSWIAFKEEASFELNYTGLEAFPLKVDEINKLNYSAQVNFNGADMFFSLLHDLEWNQHCLVEKGFEVEKVEIEVQNYKNEDNFDLIYFDAFAPNAQAELWTETIFKLMYNLLKNKGVLVTYCAKGDVRRGLQSVGFVVERIDGPPGKREMLRAIK